MPRIKDLIKEEKEPWISFEFFPPKSEAGVEQLYAKIDKLKQLGNTL